MSQIDDIREELRKEFREYKTKMERDLRKEIRDHQKSLEFMNTELKNVKQQQKELEKENKKLKESNAKLVDEVEVLKKQSSEHEQRITAAEQYSRNSNL